MVGDGTEVVYALGCHVNDPSTDGIPEAVDAATGSDVAILVLGDKTGLVSDAIVGETRDRSTLELAGAQRPLLEAVCATGVPVVVVIARLAAGSRCIAEEGGPAAVIHAYQPGSVGWRRRSPTCSSASRTPPAGSRSRSRGPPASARSSTGTRTAASRAPTPTSTTAGRRTPSATASATRPSSTGPSAVDTDRGRRRGFGPGAGRGGEHGRPRRRGGRAALRVDPAPRRHPSRAGARRFRPRLARSRLTRRP